MLKRLAAALVLFLAVASPAYAQWDSAAVQALPYLYHEQELKADITALDGAMQKLYLSQLHDYYLAEVNKQPYVLQSFPEPLAYNDLSGQYVSLYQDIQNNFLAHIDADKDGLLSRLENDERQAYRNTLSSADMVQLKNFYLKRPAFFDLPLSYANYQRYGQDIAADPKFDLPQRQALAQQLAGLLRLQDANYAVEGDELHAILPDVVEKNLIAGLTNNFTTPQLGEMLAQAQSEAGQNFLRMKESAFKNRFISLLAIYRSELAAAVDGMPEKIALLPQLSYPQIIRFHHHRDNVPDRHPNPTGAGTPSAHSYEETGIRMGTSYCPNTSFKCDALEANREAVFEAAHTCVNQRFGIDVVMTAFEPGDQPSEGCVTPGDVSGMQAWASCCAKKHEDGACMMECTRYIAAAKQK